MRRARATAILGLVLVSVIGCDRVKSLYRRYTSREGIVGTWRQTDSQRGEVLTFGSDGSFQGVFNPDPRLPPRLVASITAMEKAKAKYRRAEDTVVVSYDMRSLSEALCELGQTDPLPAGETTVLTYKYKLDGDDLDLTINGKTHRYARVR